jgi:hypothetical protein
MALAFLFVSALGIAIASRGVTAADIRIKRRLISPLPESPAPPATRRQSAPGDRATGAWSADPAGATHHTCERRTLPGDAS